MAFKRSSNSAGGLQVAFDSGTPAQKAAFQAAVSGEVLASGDITGESDRTRINAALSGGGNVTLAPNSVFWVNGPLIYGSSTRLTIPASSTIRQSPGSNQPILRSKAYVDFLSGGTSVVLTQVSKNFVNVGWANHGLSVGSGVWLWGAALSVYNGVFRVAQVIDDNNFRVYTQYMPSAAPSGSVFAVKAVQRFEMSGGVLDYNYAQNSGSANNVNAHVTNHFGLIDCHFENTLSINGNKYGHCFCATLGLTWSNLRAANRSDGVKVYGPCTSLRGRGVHGIAQDDIVSLHTREGAGYTGYQPVYGDVIDAELSNISGDIQVAGSLCVLYASDDEVMDRVKIDGVSGTPIVAGVRVATGFSVGKILGLTLENVSAFGSSNISLDKSTISDLRIVACKPNPDSATGSNQAIVSQTSLSEVTRLVIDGGNSNYPASGEFAVTYLAGKTKSLTLKNFAGDAASGQGLVYFAGASWSCGRVDLENCYTGAGGKYAVKLASAPASGSVHIALTNNVFAGSGVVSVEAPGVCTVTVSLASNSFTGQSLGVVRSGNANHVIDIRSNGANKFQGASPLIVSYATAPSYSVYGFDLSLDVGGIVGLSKTVSGQYCYHTGSGRGTLTQNRLVTCNGASWVQVDTPANIY